MLPEKLPLPHFKRAIAQFAVTPEAHNMLFAGTSIDQLQLASPDFDLTPSLLWQVCENIEKNFGPGWYFDVPSIWKSDLHGALEAAMRFAPTLLAALTTLERYSASRWGIAGYRLSWEKHQLRINAHRNVPVQLRHWQMLVAIFTLNVETIFEFAFPQVLPKMAHFMVGPPPRPIDELGTVFQSPVTWDCASNSSTVPREFLETPSVLADSRQFAMMISVLESEIGSVQSQWSSRVTNALADGPTRPSGPDIAASFGLSFRTLERRLNMEGTGFRQLREDRFRSTFELLAKNPSLTLADIVTRMGYSDESALSRATRRWYGATATAARRRLQSQ